jgi:DNA polymerase elongation subunit (family B)
VLHFFGEVSGFKIKDGIKINESKIEGYPVNVCSAEDYLIMRASVWHEEDKQKAIVIVRAQGKNLNLDYLMKRAKEEKVTRRIKWLLKFQK